MKTRSDIAQLFLRLSLGVGFALPVLDRFGLLGQPGEEGINWGKWENFVGYTNILLPYVNFSVANFMGAAATGAETIFAITLIIGFKTRLASLGSFLLTLIFALSMFFFVGRTAPFSSSVFTVSAASLLLSCMPVYRWSIDSPNT
ncbi:DoxX family membrane protein [Dyadobacter sp. CY351]|uniref:DoxX family membrane protein n=1 Tax=Dyadobacter sp. CY351 TaxID=2909337 RepID=UPI001F15D65E|nr:DoxX family membrane protein [Dyadobacter sp. CY351]MCF2518366.1 DoxX family membrane protein [Dyadobacter sp. CY351]